MAKYTACFVMKPYTEWTALKRANRFKTKMGDHKLRSGAKALGALNKIVVKKTDSVYFIHSSQSHCDAAVQSKRTKSLSENLETIKVSFYILFVRMRKLIFGTS